MLNKYLLHKWQQNSSEDEFVFRILILHGFPPLPFYLSVLMCLLIFAWIFVITIEKLPVGVL